MSEPIVTFDEQAIRSDLEELVVQAVEDVLNELLEGDSPTGAERHERTARCEACRASRCNRRLVTTSGEVTARMSQFKGMRFTPAVIERCHSREASIEKFMSEMDACTHWFNERRIKRSLDGMSPLQYRRSLELAAWWRGAEERHHLRHPN